MVRKILTTDRTAQFVTLPEGNFKKINRYGSKTVMSTGLTVIDRPEQVPLPVQNKPKVVLITEQNSSNYSDRRYTCVLSE